MPPPVPRRHGRSAGPKAAVCRARVALERVERRIRLRIARVGPGVAAPYLLCVGVGAGAGDLRQRAAVAVVPAHLERRGLAEAQLGERLPRLRPERLAELRRVDLGQAHFYL